MIALSVKEKSTGSLNHEKQSTASSATLIKFLPYGIFGLSHSILRKI